MKLSIITPCSRPYNLPTIYASILEMKTNDVEWIVVFDNTEIDKRILMYEKNIPIILLSTIRHSGDNYASTQRNAGIEMATGDYLYFLDDDNLVHRQLYNKLCRYATGDNIVMFNQFIFNRQRKRGINIKTLKAGELDTGQFLVPRKYKSRWRNDRQFAEEFDYIMDLIQEVGCDKFLWVDRLFTYRNYLRKYIIK